MKNLIITSALVLALGASASASTIISPKGVTISQQKEYKKIEESKVPAAVLSEVSTKYEGYKITEAAVAADDEYRITVAKDTKTVKIYFTATGEFVKEEK